RSPSSFSVTPSHGPGIRLAEPQAPMPPRFDLAVALTPLVSDRVVLAVHAAPRALAHLTVVRGATRTSARLLTDAAGFGYATMRLTGHVVPAALRVRVAMGRSTLTLTPWLSPGWVPSQGPAPWAQPTATPIPTATPAATPTLTSTAKPAPTAMPLPIA